MVDQWHGRKSMELGLTLHDHAFQNLAAALGWKGSEQEFIENLERLDDEKKSTGKSRIGNKGHPEGKRKGCPGPVKK